MNRSLSVAGVSIDGHTLTINVPDLKPTWCMEITYPIKSGSGPPVTQTIHNTIHQLAD